MKYNVLVKPGSKVEGVEVVSDDELVVRTHARAHDGEANKEVVRLLSKHLGIAKSCIEIKSGLKSKRKVVETLS